MPSVLRILDRLRRSLLLYRRGLAAVCIGLAAWILVATLQPGPPVTVGLWTAARDLPAGAVLASGDLRRTGFLPDSVPAAATRNRDDLIGRTLATPLGQGEVATQTQVVGNDRLAGYPDRAAVGLRIPDAEAAALLRPGDRVDLVASDPQEQDSGVVLVSDAAVLVVPRIPPDAGSSVGSGRLVVFAVPAAEVARIAAVGTSQFLSVIWTR